MDSGVLQQEIVALSGSADTAEVQAFQPDDLYRLIATRAIHVDLGAVPLAQRNQVKLYLNIEAAEALQLVSRNIPAKAERQSISVKIEIGAPIVWGERTYTILNFNSEMVHLICDGQDFRISTNSFEESVKRGEIVGLKVEPTSGWPTEVKKLFESASAEDLRIATERYKIITGGQKASSCGFTKRTINRWKRHYWEAEQRWGIGYVALLPRFKACGNRTPRFSGEIQQIAERIIDEHYLTLKQKRALSVYGTFALECERNHFTVPSYQYFMKTIKMRSRYRTLLARKGKRAAYSLEPSMSPEVRSTGVHGDRPWAIAHVDHTQADIELVCGEKGTNLGRPWLSVMFDAHSRRVLAFELTFDPPSYRTCMNLFRECVRRHGRLPDCVVTDNGKEFHSIYFEALAATFECTLKKRPPAQSRFGSIIEKYFGTLNSQFFHNLQGNTQLMKAVRQVTKSVNPKNHAIWTLERLFEALSVYIYKLYDERDHPATHMSPRRAYELGMSLAGRRSHRVIRYDPDFIVNTLPTTRTGKATVQPREGVKINYFYYWHEEMQNGRVEGTKVDVRYDPFNLAIAYARLNGRWVECRSNCPEFKSHTEREVKLAAEVLRKQNRIFSGKMAIRAKTLAVLLESTDREECLLIQRQKDLAQRNARLLQNAPNVSEVTLQSAGACEPMKHPSSPISEEMTRTEAAVIENQDSKPPDHYDDL